MLLYRVCMLAGVAAAEQTVHILQQKEGVS